MVEKSRRSVAMYVCIISVTAIPLSADILYNRKNEREKANNKNQNKMNFSSCRYKLLIIVLFKQRVAYHTIFYTSLDAQVMLCDCLVL